ncbi:hypothetical protein F5X97DRAFT_324098 [Nemania serpens]|nr:hypothetical protein F5X97DRAFT_324098 [Nemania serpens]
MASQDCGGSSCSTHLSSSFVVPSSSHPSLAHPTTPVVHTGVVPMEEPINNKMSALITTPTRCCGPAARAATPLTPFINKFRDMLCIGGPAAVSPSPALPAEGDTKMATTNIAGKIKPMSMNMELGPQTPKTNNGPKTWRSSRWADDEDLSPILTPCRKAKQAAAKKSSVGCSLASTTQAMEIDEPVAKPFINLTANNDKPKQEATKRSLKGLSSSRWAVRGKPLIDAKMLEGKFKRELAEYGLVQPQAAVAKVPATLTTPPTTTTPPPKKPTTHTLLAVAPATAPATNKWQSLGSSHGNLSRGRGGRQRDRSNHNHNHNHDNNNNDNNNTHDTTRKYKHPRKSFKGSSASWAEIKSKGKNAADTEEETQRNYPVRMDMDEFQREVAEYGLKTLKDSRWAGKGEDEKMEEDEAEEPRNYPVQMDMEEFRHEVAEHGLKTLQDSRWADDAEEKMEEDEPEEPRNYPVHMDMEEFRREVAEHGLKTLKDSRWADDVEEKMEEDEPEEPRHYPVRMDMEEFRREAAEDGLKTLSGSRWSN